MRYHFISLPARHNQVSFRSINRYRQTRSPPFHLSVLLLLKSSFHFLLILKSTDLLWPAQWRVSETLCFSFHVHLLIDSQVLGRHDLCSTSIIKSNTNRGMVPSGYIFKHGLVRKHSCWTPHTCISMNLENSSVISYKTPFAVKEHMTRGRYSSMPLDTLWTREKHQFQAVMDMHYKPHHAVLKQYSDFVGSALCFHTETTRISWVSCCLVT